MKIRKILISLLLLLCIVLVMNVSSAENNLNTVTLSNDTSLVNDNFETNDISVDYISNTDNIRSPAKTVYITEDSYDTYFNKYTGKIKSDSGLKSGDIIKIGNVTNKAFVIDRKLTLSPITSEDKINNGVIHLIEGSNGSTVTGLKIYNTAATVKVDGIDGPRLHGIWLTKTNHNTISYNTIRIADAPGVYGMPMGWSSYNTIVYNDIKTYITCTMVMGQCHYNLIDNNKMETLSYSSVSVTNLIYYNPYSHADYSGPATSIGNNITNNFLKSFSTGDMSIVLQLLGNSSNTKIINNTIIKGSYGIGIVANNVTIKENTFKDSFTSILTGGTNVSVVSNIILGNTVNGGIHVSGDSNSFIIVSNNSIDVESVFVGIKATGCSDIFDNHINIRNYGIGISILNNSNRVRNNFIKVVQDSGISFLGNYSFIDNNIIYTKAKGVIISSDSNVNRYYYNNITNNKIFSDSYGIFIKGLIYYTTISNNVIETNASAGIYKEITDELSDNSSDNMINGVIYNATALIINDTNFYNYFTSDGYLNYTFKENKTPVIIFTFLSNKDVYFNEKINIISNKMKNLLLNVRFHLMENASGSLVRDFNFYNINKGAIILDGVNNVNLNNNNITIILNNDSSLNSAILVQGICDNCIVNNNNIYINSKSNFTYGISISAYHSITHKLNSRLSKDFKIFENNIIMITTGLGEGIYADAIIESEIIKNNINIIADSFAYGIATGNIIGRQFNLNISDNEIIIHSKKMAYLIELHMNDNVSIINNHLSGTGNGIYGIATFLSNNISIFNNDINILGGDLSKIGTNYDVLGNGNSPIFISKFSNITNIYGNIIYTNTLDQIKINNNNSIINIAVNSYVIDNENYINYFNNVSNMILNDVIKSEDVLLFNNFTKGKLLIINVPVNITYYNNIKTFKASLIFLNGSFYSNITGLTFINSDVTLNDVFNITISNNLFISNSNKNVVKIIKGYNNTLINNSFNITGANSEVIILDNTFYNIIKNNSIFINVTNTAKGIIIRNSNENYLIFNKFTAIGENLQLITSFNSKYNHILSNILKVNGSSIFGYYGFNSHFNLIQYNEMIICGKNHFTNQSGVYYNGNSSSNIIKNNKILSYSKNKDDYAVIIVSNISLFNSVTNNYLISSNGSKRANYAVLAQYDLVTNNTPWYIYVSSTNGSDYSGDGSLENPYKTIKYALLNCLNHGVIYLLSGVYNDSNLIIDRNITLTAINTNGDVFIELNKNHLFNITTNGILTINDLKISNAYNLLGGSVFINRGTLLINNSIISNCTSVSYNHNGSYGYGGVILNYGNLIINSSAFYNNLAHKGGVLYDEGETLIYNSLFINNSAVSGGVMYTNTTKTIVILNSVFKNNTAIITLDYCTVVKGYNHGEYYSGCCFFNQTIRSFGCGGVIFSNSPIVIEKSLFEYNKAGNGGVVAQQSSFGEYSTFKPNATLHISDSIFRFNSATDTKCGNLSLLSYYAYNYHSGGVIYGTLSKITIENSTFEYNQATSDGGALYAQSKDGVINGSVFTDNRAGSAGGALHLSGNFLITNTIINNNSARYGGALRYESFISYGHVQNNINAFNCTISNNRALNYGGALWLGPANVTISNSNIVNNFAPSGSTLGSNYHSASYVNAVGNWWGTKKGPDDSVWNFRNIKFREWLKNEVLWKPIVTDPQEDDPGIGPGTNPSNPPVIIPGVNTGPSIGTGDKPGQSGEGSGSGGSGGGSGSGGSGGGSGSGGSGEGSGSGGSGDSPWGSGSSNGTGNVPGGSGKANNTNLNDLINGNVNNGTVDFNSLSRTNSSNVNSDLVSVGFVPNAASSSSSSSSPGEKGERSSKSGGSSSGSSVYELSKQTMDTIKKITYSTVTLIIGVIIVILLLLFGYKRRNKEDDY